MKSAEVLKSSRLLLCLGIGAIASALLAARSILHPGGLVGPRIPRPLEEMGEVEER